GDGLGRRSAHARRARPRPPRRRARRAAGGRPAIQPHRLAGLRRARVHGYLERRGDQAVVVGGLRRDPVRQDHCRRAVRHRRVPARAGAVEGRARGVRRRERPRGARCPLPRDPARGLSNARAGTPWSGPGPGTSRKCPQNAHFCPSNVPGWHVPEKEMLPVNRRELGLALAERTETDRRTADEMLAAFTDIVTETVSTGEPVAISGFCKFARVDRAARMGRNPQTGEPIRIKASRKARITPLKAFKDAVLTGKRAGARKSPAKKTAARKTTAKKAPAKRGAVKKTTARKTTAKKTTAKKTTRRR